MNQTIMIETVDTKNPIFDLLQYAIMPSAMGLILLFGCCVCCCQIRKKNEVDDKPPEEELEKREPTDDPV